MERLVYFRFHHHPDNHLMSTAIDRVSLQTIFSIIETDLGDLKVNSLARSGDRRELSGRLGDLAVKCLVRPVPATKWMGMRIPARTKNFLFLQGLLTLQGI